MFCLHSTGYCNKNNGCHRRTVHLYVHKIVIANAIPKNINLGGRYGLYKSRRNSAN